MLNLLIYCCNKQEFQRVYCMRAFLCCGSLNESNILFMLGDIIWMVGWHNFHSFYYQFVLGIFGNSNLKHFMHEISLSLCSLLSPKNKLHSSKHIHYFWYCWQPNFTKFVCPLRLLFCSCEKHLKYWICLKSPKYIISKRVYENLC